MRTRGILLAAVAALVLAACGGDDGDDAGAAATTDEAATETTAASDPEATETDGAATTEAADDRGIGYGSDDASGETSGEMSGDAAVTVASSSLGDIVVDGDGMTLYVFLPDEGGTPTCTEGCAEAWPPFAGPAGAGDGIDGTLLGTAAHPSGLTMVTYGGWPLYHFANDAAPGDVNGQGVGGNWYVIAPDGTPIQE